MNLHRISPTATQSQHSIATAITQSLINQKAPDTVIFEVKPGPYDAATDKEFAPWAPPEGDPRAHAYLIQLEDQFRQHFSLPER